MKRSTIYGAWLVSAAMIFAACGGSSSSSGRVRNLTGSDGYEVPRVHTYEYVDAFDRAASREWGAGYTTAGPDRWDPNTYDIGQGRARAASAVYEEVGPRVPPRTNRPGSAAPPIYERPVSSRLSARAGTTAPKVSSGALMKTQAFGKILGGLGNMGSMMAGSIAMAGIGMAMQALGAPPFLMALFGGPDAATMAALQEIMKTLEEMNKKLDQINGKLDELKVSVNDLGAAVQALAGSVCDESVTQSINALNDIVDPIDNQWMRIYVDNKLAVGDSKSNTFTSEQLEYFDMSQAAITKLDPLSIIDKIEAKTLGNAALSNLTGAQTGLLSQVQKCTMVRSRFLTNADTARWQSLVILLMMSQAKAAELATWNEIYTAMKAKRAPSITQLNLINLQLRHTMSAMGFNVSMQIPEGQVLDTVSNKMWRMAPSGTTKIGLQDALTACLPDEDRFVNYAPVPSWNGMATRDLSMCVATRNEALKNSAGKPTGSPLDLGVGSTYARGTLPEGDWRIPTLAEISTYGRDAVPTGAADTVGLLDGGGNVAGGTYKPWAESMCGNARATTCSTPASYLSTYGFANVPNDLGVVWSNSTLSQFGKGGHNKDSGVAWSADSARNSYNNNWSPAGTGIYGFCEDDKPMKMKGTSVMCPNNAPWPWLLATAVTPRIPTTFALFSANALDHFCFRFTSKVWKSGHTRDEWFSPFTPEVAAVNFGTDSNAYVDPVYSILRDDEKPWKDTNYGLIKTGAYGSKFASRTLSNATIACGHDWYMATVAKLPQTAQAMWVRNLAPNESYYSVSSTQTTSTVRQLRSFQPELQPASVSILSMNGQAVIHSRFPTKATGDYFVKCLVNPADDPLTPQEVIDKGTDCPQLSFAWPDGQYRVYAATIRRTDTKTILSNLEIADIGISSKFANIPGSIPSTSVLEPSTVPESLAVLKGLGTSTPKSTSQWSNIPSTATSLGAFDIGALLVKAKVKLKSGDKVSVKVAAKSIGVCTYAKPTLTGLRVGSCAVSLTVTSKKGKKSTKKLTISVK